MSEVFESIKLLLNRMSAMYPQALIVYTSILPRLDIDNGRVADVNRMVKEYIFTLDMRFEALDCYDDFMETVFPGPKKVPIKEYFRMFNRNGEDDAVHLSDSGTQVQQDAYNRFFGQIKDMIRRLPIDRSALMWQTEWDRFHYWNLKTPSIVPNEYLRRKRLTNFTAKQYDELLKIEEKQKTREVIGPQTKFEATRKVKFQHLGDD